MDWLGYVLPPILAALATLGAARYVFRGTRVQAAVAESQAEADATTAFLAGQQAFQAFTEKLVAERVAAAVAPMQQQLAGMEARLAEIGRETHEMHNAVRAYVTQVWLWDLRGRPGPVPELPRPILARLSIGHLSSAPADIDEDTLPIPPRPPSG